MTTQTRVKRSMKMPKRNRSTEIHVPTSHLLILGDARKTSDFVKEKVHLVLTSPPYWTLKRYNEHKKQMGHIEDYHLFLDDLDKVWRSCFDLLVPGGRLICVVGDVCISRRKGGRHRVVPLHADIVTRCRDIGFDNLNPIIWHKISNASFEVENGTKFLGKPYEPNAIIKNDMEFILMLRKPGGYRQPTDHQRASSMISKDEFKEWFRQIWTIRGASTKSHPAPFPRELAYRLIRMFSFTGDLVIDPFVGMGTTMVAAMKCDRNSIGIEIDSMYARMALESLKSEASSIFFNTSIMYSTQKMMSTSGNS